MDLLHTFLYISFIFCFIYLCLLRFYDIFILTWTLEYNFIFYFAIQFIILLLPYCIFHSLSRWHQYKMALYIKKNGLQMRAIVWGAHNLGGHHLRRHLSWGGRCPLGPLSRGLVSGGGCLGEKCPDIECSTFYHDTRTLKVTVVLWYCSTSVRECVEGGVSRRWTACQVFLACPV